MPKKKPANTEMVNVALEGAVEVIKQRRGEVTTPVKSKREELNTLAENSFFKSSFSK